MILINIWSVFLKKQALLCKDPRFHQAKWMFSWCVSFVIAMFCARTLPSSLSSLNVVGFRYIATFLTLIFFAPKTIPSVSKKITFSVFLRIFLTVIATILTYEVYRHLPLGLATTVGLTGPMISAFLAVIFLKEKWTIFQIFGFIICYAGIFCMAHPTFDNAGWVYVLVLILANIIASFTMLITRSLTKYYSAFDILKLTSFGIGTLWLCSLPFSYQEVMWSSLGGILCVSVFATLSSYSYIKALSLGYLSYATIFEYARLPLALILGYIFFDERLTWLSATGICLVFLGIGFSHFKFVVKK